MYTQVIDMHEGNIWNKFKIQRHRIDKDPIRIIIIRESIRIERALRDDSLVVMNTKNEHFGVQTVRSTFNSEWLQD